MNNKEKIKKILEDLEVPIQQISEICILTILGLGDIEINSPIEYANNDWKRVHDIIVFINKNYNKDYAENSRETIRKKAIHHFRAAALIEDNNKATNSPNFAYKLTDEFLEILYSFNTADYKSKISSFKSRHKTLVEKYRSKKRINKVPVKIDGIKLSLSSGKHNLLQKYILEEFVPRFAPDSSCLYLGDTTKKNLYLNGDLLEKIGFNLNVHNKMPDIVLYDEKKNWLYFIEAVTSVGPMNAKRIYEIEEMTKNIDIGKIFVTAFLDFKTYKKFSEDLAWETEIWLAENPEHMIHLNGDRFMGPR